MTKRRGSLGDHLVVAFILHLPWQQKRKKNQKKTNPRGCKGSNRLPNIFAPIGRLKTMVDTGVKSVHVWQLAETGVGGRGRECDY